MNILIVSSNRCKLPMPVMPVGACMVAEAVSRAGHKVSLLDLMFAAGAEAAVRSKITDFQPDIIGISVRNIDNNDMADPVLFVQELRPLVDAIRSVTDSPVILGGAALSVMPEEILGAADVPLGVLGDGEMVFPELLSRLEQGKTVHDIDGVVWRENSSVIRNAAAPAGFSDYCVAPDYTRWLEVDQYHSQLSTAPVQTKLGCQFKCVYCTYRKIEGSVYRLSGPQSVAEAVARLASTGLRDIEFVDSVFNAPYDHARAVCDALSMVKHGARLQSLELNPTYFDDALVIAGV